MARAIKMRKQKPSQKPRLTLRLRRKLNPNPRRLLMYQQRRMLRQHNPLTTHAQKLPTTICLIGLRNRLLRSRMSRPQMMAGGIVKKTGSGIMMLNMIGR
eukprot:1789460-Karenia_brevis.AAC.1